jgi:hypothetical protein
MAGIRGQDKFELWTEQLISLRKFVPPLFHVRNMFFLRAGTGPDGPYWHAEGIERRLA